MLGFIAPLWTTVRQTAQRATTPRARNTHTFHSGFAGLTLLSAAVLFPRVAAASDDTPSRAASSCAAPTMSLADLPPLKDIDGNTIDSSAFSGKVVFAMNVASACGYTSAGYDLFKRLTDKYPVDDFVAVAIPCNSFMWQENGSPEEIKTFALARAERLLVTERSDVNGKNAHPIVQLAKSKFPARVAWNFDGRYVFDRKGVPVAKFGNSASADEIEAAIDKLI